jgi:hypothetical protein
MQRADDRRHVAEIIIGSTGIVASVMFIMGQREMPAGPGGVAWRGLGKSSFCRVVPGNYPLESI